MDKNISYFDKMENVNIKNLLRFNEQYQWFKSINPTVRLTSSDAVCYTNDDRKITVELKTRKETLPQIKRYGDIVIEPCKMEHFTKIMESGYTLHENCLYINFLSDGNVVVYDFSKLKDINVYPNHKHYNPGKRLYEFETRFGLKLNDGMIFKME